MGSARYLKQENTNISANDSSEDSLIEQLRGLVRHEAALALRDDAALFADNTVVTSDMLVEDVDFRRQTFTAEDIGSKAIAVNLSDLAAMGARPTWFTLNIAVPAGSASLVLPIANAAISLGRHYGCEVVGGDLSRSPNNIVVSITAAGTCSRPLRRRCAHVGDELWVGGNLGAAAAGFGLLERGFDVNKFTHEVLAQRRPQPLLPLGQHLASLPFVRGAMDLSDGLARDLPRFLSTGQGALISALPIANSTLDAARELGVSAEGLAVFGGEDFALLFAVDPTHSTPGWTTQAPTPVCRIGTVTDDGILVHGPTSQVLSGGFDHFSR